MYTYVHTLSTTIGNVEHAEPPAFYTTALPESPHTLVITELHLNNVSTNKSSNYMDSSNTIWHKTTFILEA